MSKAVQALLERTLLATFRVQPPPQSIAHSLAVHTCIADAIAGSGKIVHYRQTMCPVTKQRLPTLHVLVEDLARPIIRNQSSKGTEIADHVVWPGSDVATVATGDRSALEQQLVERFYEAAAKLDLEEGSGTEVVELQLERATRSSQKIEELMYVRD